MNFYWHLYTIKRLKTWVAASLYWDSKGDRLRALSYVEKGLRLDDTLPMLHLLKGNLCLKLNRPDSAVSSFRKAQTLEPSISAFEGLAKAYAAFRKHKEALVTAREAVRLMPSSPRALLLLGSVYAKQGETRARAMKIFESVLRSNPNCKEAILAVIDIHVANRNLVAAEHILSKHLESNVNDDLHTRLAGIFVEGQKYGQAVEHYHIALSLNEPLFVWVEDASFYFNQFGYSPSELWKSNLVVSARPGDRNIQTMKIGCSGRQSYDLLL